MVRYRKKLVSLPIRLRNQKWDTYHLSGTQLWLDAACLFVRAESMPKAAKLGLGKSHSDDLVQRTLDASAQRPSPEAHRARPAATVPAQANRRKKEAQSHWVSWRATSSRRSQPHRCFPRPQRPAASCDSRTGRLARPASSRASGGSQLLVPSSQQSSQHTREGRPWGCQPIDRGHMEIS